MKTIKTENGTLEIRSNYHARPLIYGYELTENEKKEFDYMENVDEGLFFRFKNQLYDIGEIIRIDENTPFPDFWQGYASDSFFSGILVRLCDDTDADRLSLSCASDCVIIGQYFS